MWLVAKIKTKETETFKKNLNKKFDNKVNFYLPKFLYTKKRKNTYKQFSKPILENYIFCYHSKFNDKYFTSKNKFIEGLQYFLPNTQLDQQDIKKFINYCKNYEDSNGYLSSSFFKNTLKNKAKFITGPFSNMVFEVLNKEKNKLTILLGSIITTISDKKNYIYRSV